MRFERDQLRVLIILGVMLSIFMVAFWLPNRLHERRLHAELIKADQHLAGDQRSPDALASMVKQAADLRSLTQQSQKYVPQTDELSQLLRQLSLELEGQHVTGQEIQTGSIVHGEVYSVVPITLRFKGSFPAVYGFLKRIESMNRMVRITRLELDGDAQRTDELLTIRLEIYTFFSKPGQGGRS
jgi:Tfp pilus assembly protein PilO